MKNEHCISVCNRLLRGERSAVETYDLALRDFDKAVTPAELHDIRTDHVHAVATLSENVRSMGGTPDLESEIWGTSTQSVQGTANLLGSHAALKALEAGEKIGRNDYETALEDEEVMTECKSLIRTELLPLVDRHISALARLQAA